MALHKAGQRRGSQHHDGHGRRDGQHHHRHMVHHAYRGNDGVQRKHGIQHQNLNDDLPEARLAVLLAVVEKLPFQPLVQFHGALEEQKGPPAHEDDIPPGKIPAPPAEQRLRQAHDPGNGRQQHQPAQKGLPPPLLRQPLGQNGNKDKVVDAQHHLKQYQGAQTGPGRGIGDPCHIPHKCKQLLSCRHCYGMLQDCYGMLRIKKGGKSPLGITYGLRRYACCPSQWRPLSQLPAECG